jgi:hypothetical protein
MGKRWTSEENKILTDLYPKNATKTIAEKLGRSVKSVNSQAHILGLKKCPEYLKANVHIITNPSVRHQFKKGQTAWNKGMKGLQIGGVATQFKKGNKPFNWKPDGSERVDTDGYAMIKVNGKFILKHRYIYEQHHGKIPAGYIIIFKDKNPSNFDINNLEAITRDEHQKRNSFLNLPQEIIEVIQLKRTITKLITENGKRQNSRLKTSSI